MEKERHISLSDGTTIVYEVDENGNPTGKEHFEQTEPWTPPLKTEEEVES